MVFGFLEESESDLVQEFLQRRKIGLPEQLDVPDEPGGVESLSEDFRLENFGMCSGLGAFLGLRFRMMPRI